MIRSLSPRAGEGRGGGGLSAGLSPAVKICSAVALTAPLRIAERPPHPRSLRFLDLSPRAGRGETPLLAQALSSSRCVRTRALRNYHAQNASPEGRRSADRRTVHVRVTRSNVAIQSLRGSGSVASRSPFGAPPRHSPGRTHPPLAQLQFPRFLRPGSTSVTRCRLSRVYRAPRRPVVMPAERWPRAARE